MKLHIVPARTGVEWVRQGIQVFRRQPLALTLLCVMTMTAVQLLLFIPVIGPFVALALVPTTTLLMMEASAEAYLGRVPTPTLIAAALRVGRQRVMALVVLGAMYAALLMLVIGIATLVDGSLPDVATASSTEVTGDLAKTGQLLAASSLLMLLYLPVQLLFWHAPGLVHWHNVPPTKALFFSFMACIKNIKAFTVYGLAWFGFFLIAALCVSVVLSLLLLIGLPMAIVNVCMVITALMMATMYFSSIIFTFRDSFEAPSRAEQQPDSL